jgi:hypothetical protein
MPKGLPEASNIWEGDVMFFSIDTDLIQSAGYNFTAGVLHQLPAKLPGRMCIQLTEVVAHEIINHKMKPVIKALDQLNSATKDIGRLVPIDMARIEDDISRKNVETTAIENIRKGITDYTEKCKGGILPIQGENLSADMFERYFKSRPPFGLGKDKKAEFPDAANLLILEEYAKDNNCHGIVASGDKGAASFAENSDFLYCVSSLDELAALFVATDAHAMKIKNRIDATIHDANSSLRSKIQTAVEEHVAHSLWSVDAIFTASAAGVEGQVFEHELRDYEIEINETEIWHSKVESGTWIIDLKINAEVEVGVDVTFTIWDSIDREEVQLASKPYHITEEISFQIFLTCEGITPENDPSDWNISIDFALDDYDVNLGEVDPDMGDDSYDNN